MLECEWKWQATVALTVRGQHRHDVNYCSCTSLQRAACAQWWAWSVLRLSGIMRLSWSMPGKSAWTGLESVLLDHSVARVGVDGLELNLTWACSTGPEHPEWPKCHSVSWQWVPKKLITFVCCCVNMLWFWFMSILWICLSNYWRWGNSWKPARSCWFLEVDLLAERVLSSRWFHILMHICVWLVFSGCNGSITLSQRWRLSTSLAVLLLN